MNSKFPFKWRHFAPDIILWGVRWYCLYPISYRNLGEIMCKRGVEVDHSTLYRWVQKYAPEMDKRCRSYLQPTNDSWRVDETYIKVKGEDKYLYRAVDSKGNTLDFLLRGCLRSFYRYSLDGERQVGINEKSSFQKLISAI